MATIRCEDLDGWWKSVAFWGVLGTYLAITKSPPLSWLIFSLVGGAATGGAKAFWLSKMKSRAISITGLVGPLVFGIVIYQLMGPTPVARMPIMSISGLSCLFHAASMLVFGVAGTQAMKVVNAKNAHWLSKLGPPSERPGPPPPESTNRA
jgi:hypothetical protein